MASLDGLRVRNVLSTGVVRTVGTDTPIAILIRKTGTETATSVKVTTATNIVLVGSTTTDTVTFATYTTYGAVVDQINTTGRWEAKMMDGLRSKASASTLLDGAITSSTDANGVTQWKVFQDTSASLQLAVTLSPSMDWDTPVGHRVKLQQVVYSVNMGTAAADSFQIWRRRKTTETQLFGVLSVDTTTTTLDLALGYGTITGQNEDELIVLVKDAATLENDTANFVRFVGIIE